MDAALLALLQDQGAAKAEELVGSSSSDPSHLHMANFAKDASEVLKLHLDLHGRQHPAYVKDRQHR